MYPVAIWTSTLAAAPMVPPIPTTLPTADRGNISDVVVKRFADQPWCAASAVPTSATTTQRFLQYGAKITGTTPSAHTNIAVLRALFTVHPRSISVEESQPPPTLPMVVRLYSTSSGTIAWNNESPNVSCKYFGSQKR